MIDYKTTDEYLAKTLRFEENYDVVRRVVSVKNKKAVLYYISSLIGESNVVALIESLTQVDHPSKLNLKVYNGNLKMSEDMTSLPEQIFAGTSVLILPGSKVAYLIDVRLYPTRAVAEPITEKTIRGSRDGFVETLNVNVGLIRRRIKSDKLVIKNFTISEESKVVAAMLYIDGEADKEIVDRIEKEINEINVDSLIMSDRALEELLFKQRFSPFPLVRYTERPDVAAINMMNGKIALIVDTSASVILTPITLIDHTKHVEEFRQSPFVGSFTRFIRTLAIILSFILVPLWMCLIDGNGFNNGFTLAISSDGVKTGIIIQVLIAELIFEVIRIASIHTPSHLTSAISLVAAIILGQVSMDLGLFLPEILLLSALSSICGFATPSYELSMINKIHKIALIIIVAIFGRVGFMIALLVLFVYTVSIKVWNVPYLYPLCPFDASKAKTAFMRTSAVNKKKL